MRVSKRAIALLALPAYTIADNVHLVDFPPRVSSLSTACQTVYTDTIGGCSDKDFTSPTCSTGCVNALQAMQPVVIKACSNQGITGQNVIVAFLNSQGPQSLCSNAAEILGGGSAQQSSSSSAPANTPTLISASSTRGASSSNSALPTSTSSSVDSASSTSSVDSTTATSVVFSGTITASTVAPSTLPSSVSGAVTSSGLLLASSSASSVATGSATSTGEGDPANTENPRTGGGSPFDGQGTSGTCRTATSMLTVPMAMVVLALTVA